MKVRKQRNNHHHWKGMRVMKEKINNTYQKRNRRNRQKENKHSHRQIKVPPNLILVENMEKINIKKKQFHHKKKEN